MFMVSVEARDAGQDFIPGGFIRKGILGVHPTLKLEGYPLSVVFSYAIHSPVPSEFQAFIQPSSWRATHCPLSSVTPYILKYHPSFRHSYNPQAGGLPIVRCLQLLTPYVRKCHSCFRSSSNLQVEGHPLSVVSSYTIHSIYAGRFLHPQPQHAVRCGDRDTTRLEVPAGTPAEIQLRISRLHVH